MKRLLKWLTAFFIFTGIQEAWSQIRSTSKVQYPFQLDAGFGVGLLKAARAYDINPLFYTEGVGFQFYAAPKYYFSEDFTLGLKIGGVFRPVFTDTLDIRSEREFTPFVLLSAERYFSARNNPQRRFYVGLSTGITYIGVFQARDLRLQKNIIYVPRENRLYPTLAPKIGVAFGEFKVELEYSVTFGYNPDFLGLTLVCPLKISKPRYFLSDGKL
ncbi:MAG: hypothetical protein EAZ26_02555 [Runella slithyformis]|nr:MAG: hypothetical protein EAZ46_11680 [Runella sp.]TAG16451.1 MAG: hypothetical protein EAZ38_18725 [Cytophagales bacterium]TAG54307.1 MAG: hypothetical protein EAZ29_04730 [Runella slithyformis]TAG74072.1 MAG: hypothetical protein EAZ26_02555 [Runella slithyformis]TAG77478.1 MAG: hypothetical protein EAZ22_15610 [Cytophagales bacterium]